MDADIRYHIQPLSGRRINGFEVSWLKTGEKIFLGIADPIFDDSFFIAFAYAAGDYAKAIVIGKIHILGIENRVLPVILVKTADLRLSTMTFCGTPPKNSNALWWQPRKCSMVWETVNSTYIIRQ